MPKACVHCPHRVALQPVEEVDGKVVNKIHREVLRCCQCKAVLIRNHGEFVPDSELVEKVK